MSNFQTGRGMLIQVPGFSGMTNVSAYAMNDVTSEDGGNVQREGLGIG